MPRLTRTISGKVGIGMLVFVLAGRALRAARLTARDRHRRSEPPAPRPPDRGAPRHRLPRQGRALAGAARRALGHLDRSAQQPCSPTAAGITIGLIAGYQRSLIDPVLMRGVDVLLAFPALLVLLLLVAGLGSHVVGPHPRRRAGAAPADRAHHPHGHARGLDARLRRGGAGARRTHAGDPAPRDPAERRPRRPGGLRDPVRVLDHPHRERQLPRARPGSARRRLGPDDRREPAVHLANVWSVLAPAIMLALLTICVNLIADAYVQTLGRSSCRPARPAIRAGRGSAAAARRRSQRSRWQRARAGAPGPMSRRDRERPAASRSCGLRAFASRPRRAADRRGRLVLARGRRGPRGGRRVRLGQDDDARWRMLGYSQPGTQITGGDVRVGDVQMTTAERARQRAAAREVVSYVPQNPAGSLNPSMRVGDAIVEMVQRPPANGDAAPPVADALERVGLPGDAEFQRRFPHQLSGGQQQRVCISVALVCEPPVVVLDEPTTGLDVVTQARLLEELVRLRREAGVSMIYVTHDLAVVAGLRRPDRGHVRRADHRGGPDARSPAAPAAPVHPRPARLDPRPRPAAAAGADRAASPSASATDRPAVPSRRAARCASTHATRRARRCARSGRPRRALPALPTTSPLPESSPPRGHASATRSRRTRSRS